MAKLQNFCPAYLLSFMLANCMCLFFELFIIIYSVQIQSN